MGTKIAVNREIIAAINRAAEAAGSKSALSRQSGVNQPTLNMLSNGNTKSMTRATWEKLYAFLQPYLGEGYPAPVPQRPMRGGDFGGDAEAAPVKGKKFREVPVLTFAQAAGFEPAVEPLCDYLRETSDRTQIFFDVPDTYFALEIQGNSMEPDYPHGSIALVAAGEFPERGDIVVAKLSTGQVVIKEYHRRNGIITLTSRNPEGQNFEWNIKEQPGFILWMFPVVQVIISPRSQRHAKAQMPLSGGGDGSSPKEEP